MDTILRLILSLNCNFEEELMMIVCTVQLDVYLSILFEIIR